MSARLDCTITTEVFLLDPPEDCQSRYTDRRYRITQVRREVVAPARRGAAHSISYEFRGQVLTKAGSVAGSSITDWRLVTDEDDRRLVALVEAAR